MIGIYLSTFFGYVCFENTHTLPITDLTKVISHETSLIFLPTSRTHHLKQPFGFKRGWLFSWDVANKHGDSYMDS